MKSDAPIPTETCFKTTHRTYLPAKQRNVGYTHFEFSRVRQTLSNGNARTSAEGRLHLMIANCNRVEEIAGVFTPQKSVAVSAIGAGVTTHPDKAASVMATAIIVSVNTKPVLSVKRRRIAGNAKTPITQVNTLTTTTHGNTVLVTSTNDSIIPITAKTTRMIPTMTNNVTIAKNLHEDGYGIKTQFSLCCNQSPMNDVQFAAF